MVTKLKSDGFISKYIETTRVDKGLSLTDLAAMSGINRTTLSRFENGTTSLSVANLLRVMDALDVTLAALETVPA